ncbi:HAD-IA family hydrolase [Paenibacillus alvei]|uniref:HAD family hydrolase n=1 Tax=Paenibacillus alvei TaxID=44250 RepID=UPI00155AD6A7
MYQERINEKIAPFLHIRSDILELLEYLRKNNIKIGLISNCTEEEVRYWYESKLAQYFDEIIFSYEVGIAKPNIRIYQLACERLSVSPQESIFVGDGGSNELDGAYNSGLRTYHAIWFSTCIEK